MIKNLKLNIKNTQLAEALHKSPAAASEEKSAKARAARTKKVAENKQEAPGDEESKLKTRAPKKGKTKAQESAEALKGETKSELPATPVRRARILREPKEESAKESEKESAKEPEVLQAEKSEVLALSKTFSQEVEAINAQKESANNTLSSLLETSTEAQTDSGIPSDSKPASVVGKSGFETPSSNIPSTGQTRPGPRPGGVPARDFEPRQGVSSERPSLGSYGASTSPHQASGLDRPRAVRYTGNNYQGNYQGGQGPASRSSQGDKPTRSFPSRGAPRQGDRPSSFDSSRQPFKRPYEPRQGESNRLAHGERAQVRSGLDSVRRPFRPGEIRESFSERQARMSREQQERFQQEHAGDLASSSRPRLGPTGRHFKDLVPSRNVNDKPIVYADQEKAARAAAHGMRRKEEKSPLDTRAEEGSRTESSSRTFDRSKPSRVIKKPAERVKVDASSIDEDSTWRKKRTPKRKQVSEDLTIRPSSLHIRLPVTIKDLAQEMKLKASQLIAKLFLQGMAVTLNDILDDETTVQLLGHEFGCEITIDRSEDERIRITSRSIAEEISAETANSHYTRPPVVAFMGHVDHGKTSLIDSIRKSNRVAAEAGAITQHIGAFSCQTSHGNLTILDTPGHEAFAAMRERGAQITDVIVLVVAGDEGMKPQTDEAISHAKSVGATILVAINKCDKPNFNADNVYRQLAERDLLPEVWGGKIITVNCSATTGEGIDTLLEMVALQSQILELKANPDCRARGSVIEAELHKGLGNVATVIVRNGTLKIGDALVFNQSFGRVKTMRDEFSKNVQSAGPSTAVRITGLSSLPEAGEEFIVVASEKEARDIAETRAHQIREKQVLQNRKKFSMEALLTHSQGGRKVLYTILRADMQGSVEALRFELLKIKSDKVDINIVSESIGEITESDVELAAASGAVIIGFHTSVEAHAESLIKQREVKVRCFDVIYHAVDGVKELMTELLDKIPEEHQRAKLQVLAVFKSSQLGKIAGCQVIEGPIARSHRVRILRGGKVIWEGGIASLKRNKDDVREVAKGHECGLLCQGFNDFEVGDMIESYEILYRSQSL